MIIRCVSPDTDPHAFSKYDLHVVDSFYQDLYKRGAVPLYRMEEVIDMVISHHQDMDIHIEQTHRCGSRVRLNIPVFPEIRVTTQRQF